MNLIESIINLLNIIKFLSFSRSKYTYYISTKTVVKIVLCILTTQLLIEKIIADKRFEIIYFKHIYD